MSLMLSSLSSRGWAFLIFAGGLVLSVPFIKAGRNDNRYTSISGSKAMSNRASAANRGPLASPSIPIPSTSPAINSLTQGKSTIPRTSIDAAGIVELKPTAGQSAVLEATESTPNGTTQVMIEQPARAEPEAAIDTMPIRTELPAWAKKASLIDSLFATASNETSSSMVTDSQTLPARKPTPYQAWIPDQKSELVASGSANKIERHSPFTDNVESEYQQPTSTRPRWPDEDPRAAVSQPLKPRLVGRDAMIRDPEIIKSLTEPIGKTVVHPGVGSADFPSLKPTHTVVQPKFGQSNSAANGGPQIGPALRSKLPPDEQQFIRQPSP